MSARRTAKLARLLRWPGPSVAAASAGALAAGLWEAAGLDGLAIGAAAGFVAIVSLPILFALSVIGRGLWVAWRPAELGLVDGDGRAPRLAGWIATLWVSALVLAWSLFQGTWVLAAWTAFKPFTLSFALPMIGVTALVVLVAVSRPLARAMTWLFDRLDRRVRVTPRRIAITIAVLTVTAILVIWNVMLKHRIGTLDLTVLYPPVIALVALVAVHALWGRFGRARRAVGYALTGAVLGTIAIAAFAWRAEPSLTLAIWGERPLAGLAIDKLLDLDSIRARVSLAEFRPNAKPGSQHPDIILITIDTVRADHTPPYGGSAEMPLLRELGVRGAVFDWAFAPSNVTRRSIPSMATGLAPNRVRGRVVGWALRVDPRHVVVAERLQAGGYDTAGFVCCYGFWGADFRTGLQRGLQHLEIEPNGMKLAKQARAWLEAREKTGAGKPLFLWMHILEPHNWLQGSAPASDEERRRLYDRALTAADAMMVETLGAFSTRPPERAPIVIVSADHGEGLGDHNQPYHSTDLYNSQIRVPLVIAGPGIKPGHIGETVSLTDLAPSILELAGFEVPHTASMDGKSFAELATGARASREDGGVAFSAMIKDRSNPGGVNAIVRGGWKLIDTGTSVELYRLPDDPGEKTNMATAKPQVLDELKKLLREHVEAGSRSPFD